MAKLHGRVIASGKFDDLPLVRIGRSDQNDLRIENLAFSNYHAEITHANGVYQLRDLDSSNGTYVNGERIIQRYLNDCDVIGISKFVIGVSLPPCDPISPPISNRVRYQAMSETARIRSLALTNTALRTCAHVVRSRWRRDETISMRGNSLSIGSGRESSIRVRGFGVPRRLALIVRGCGGYSLLSFGRIGAVRLNGATAGPRSWLSDGDRLELGRTVLTFREGSPEARA